uniref:Conserved plasma membrane protein n=1 Tax=Syphacia muris TaxID=451379 RepID=A0A0N5A8T6_9BILA
MPAEDLAEFDESNINNGDNDVPMVFICVLVVLLVLLASAIWIAFFSALRKAIKRFAEMKEYRRRQNVLAALAASGPIGNMRAYTENASASYGLGCNQSLTGTYIRQISSVLSVPPSYEEAIRQQQQQPQQQQRITISTISPLSPATVANQTTTSVGDSNFIYDATPVAATLSHIV